MIKMANSQMKFIRLLYIGKIFADCYQTVYVISLGLAQTDHIKWLPLNYYYYDNDKEHN
jgi:hypothetical protein